MLTSDTDILFVLVLYNIKLEHSLTYLSIVNYVKIGDHILDLLVYDNSSKNTENLLPDHPNINIIYIKDENNGGVSKAYNKGAEIASKIGKTWLLILDQDSFFATDAVPKYISSIRTYPHIHLFSPLIISDTNKVISPCLVKMKRGFYAKNRKTGLRSLRKYSPINSGMCIRLSVFKRNQGYNEHIKLDFSDFEFIDRYRVNISNLFVVVNTTIEHQLSTTLNNSFENDLNRFNYYLAGGTYYAKTWTDKLFVTLHAFLRALKLSVLHKKINFLKAVLLK